MDQIKNIIELLEKRSVMSLLTMIVILLPPLIDSVQNKAKCKDFMFSLMCNPQTEYNCNYYVFDSKKDGFNRYCQNPETYQNRMSCIPDYEKICMILDTNNGTVKEYVNSEKSKAGYYSCAKELPPLTRRMQQWDNKTTRHCLYSTHNVSLPHVDNSHNKRNKKLPPMASMEKAFPPQHSSIDCYHGKTVYPLVINDIDENYSHISFKTDDNAASSVIYNDQETKLYKRCFQRNDICSILVGLNVIKGNTAKQDVHYELYTKCVNGSIINKNDISSNSTLSQSSPVKSFDSRVNSGESPLSISEDLLNVTSSQTLNGVELIATANILKQLTQQKPINFSRAFTNVDITKQGENANKLLSSVVGIGSNLLNVENGKIWKNLGDTDQKKTATSVLIGIEQGAFSLADNIYKEDIIEVKEKNILLSVRVLNSSNIENQVFLPMPSKEKWTTSSIHLPKEALIDYDINGLVRIVFMTFDGLNEVMQPQFMPEKKNHLKKPDMIEDLQEFPENQEWNVDSDTSSSKLKIINSNVIAACINDPKRNQLRKPVSFTLHHLRTDVSNPSCVYWDEKLSIWSTHGCIMKWTNATHTGCECNHLTSFAVLMDVNSVPLSSSDTLALHLITTVGCAISILALFAAMIIFHCFKGMKSDRNTIHKNLCACLLVAELIFLFGIERTSDRVFCGFIAAFLHYFFLAAFVWMFLEGFQLYAMLIEVFEPECVRTRWYYPVAYITPLIIVGISAMVDHTSYGTPQLCWLRSDNNFILSFIVPVAVILLANWSSLFMVIYIMCHHPGQKNGHVNSSRITIWLRSSIFLAILLGLTWTFGFLYQNKQTTFMAYIFSIFNSLQGLFIFIFHCLLNETFQKECRRLSRHHKWLSCCLNLTSEPTSMSMTGCSTAPHTKLSAQSSASLNYGSSFNSNDTQYKTPKAARTHEIICAERFILDHVPPPASSTNEKLVIDTTDTINQYSDKNLITKDSQVSPLTVPNKINGKSFRAQKLNKTYANIHSNPKLEEISVTKIEDADYDVPKTYLKQKQEELLEIENEYDVYNRDFDNQIIKNEQVMKHENENEYKTEEVRQNLKKVVTFKSELECNAHNTKLSNMDSEEKKMYETEDEYAVYNDKSLLDSGNKKNIQTDNNYDSINTKLSHQIPLKEDAYETENEYAVYNTECNGQHPKK